MDGQRTYVEPFVIIKFNKAAVDANLKPFDTLVDGLVAFFGTTAAGGAAASMGITVAVGTILALVTKVGGALIKSSIIDSDGTMTQYIAYHYFGGSSSGVDPTAWPIPGVDPNTWFGHVNDLIRSAAGRAPAPSAERMVGAASSAPIFSNTSPKFDFEALHMKEASPQTLKGNDDFYGRFNACMSAQGLPVPSSLFQSATAAMATINTLYAAVKTFGTAVTISDLIVAGALGEYMAAAGALSASYYLGACIGCAINAGLNIDPAAYFFG